MTLTGQSVGSQPQQGEQTGASGFQYNTDLINHAHSMLTNYGHLLSPFQKQYYQGTLAASGSSIPDYLGFLHNNAMSSGIGGVNAPASQPSKKLL